MKRISFAIFAFFVLFLEISTSLAVQASGKYTESISINGTNDVKYEYIQHEPPEKDDDETNVTQNTYIYVKPYQYTTWSHYPRYNYHHYNPYGNQVVYTYNITGIKTGPDGRMITPLMEREFHDYYFPPMPPPSIHGRHHHPIHRPIHPKHFRY